jgi:hypothetical protein
MISVSCFYEPSSHCFGVTMWKFKNGQRIEETYLSFNLGNVEGEEGITVAETLNSCSMSFGNFASHKEGLRICVCVCVCVCVYSIM